MKKLITYSYEVAGGCHLRLLGAMQDGWRDGDPTLAVFIAQSCVRDSAWLASADAEKAVHADNVLFSNANWDSTNSCFSSEPTLEKSPTGYKDIASAECSCFKIRWEMEPPRTQRTVGNVSVDTEGVRRGTMVVELPYYVLAPSLATPFTDVCSSARMDYIISSSMS